MRKTKNPNPPSKIRKEKQQEFSHIFNSFVTDANTAVQVLIVEEKIFLKFQQYIANQIEVRKGLTESPCLCKRIQAEAEVKLLEGLVERLKQIESEETEGSASSSASGEIMIK